MIVLSTINRTPLAKMLTITAAEHLLKWVEPGTHDFAKYRTPQELADDLQSCQFQVSHLQGITYSPINGQWVRVHFHAANYFMTARHQSKAS